MEFFSEPALWVAVIEVLFGLWLITFSADNFVEGAANVAHISKISPIIIGAVIVGFGTSAPELLVSGFAALNGELDLGAGNIVGSNVANLTLVLGAASLVVPIKISKRIVKKEAALALTATLLFACFALGRLYKWEGLILLVFLVSALTWIVVTGRATEENIEDVDSTSTIGSQITRTFGGLVGTVASAQLLVWGAKAIAEYAGLSEGFVGLSLIAVGTSLPELVTGIVAAKKGKTDLILGNLLGSNMFNSLAVGGVIAVVGGGTFSDTPLIKTSILIMSVITIFVFLLMVRFSEIKKPLGIVLLTIWASSLIYLGVF